MVGLARGFCAVVLVSVLVPSMSAVMAEPPGDGFPEGELFRALTTGREDAKLAALDRLDAFGQDKRVADLLVKVLKKARTDGTVPDSTFRKILMLGRFPGHEAGRDLLVGLLTSKNPKIVIVAADALGEIGDAAALEQLVKLVDSPHFTPVYGFRKCVLQAVMKIKDPKAVEFVVGQLPKLTGQLLYDAVRYLSYVSAQRFGTNSQSWKTWWDDNAEDFKFESTKAYSTDIADPEDFVWEGNTAEFFGTYIYAKRLIFVLDISSSMRADVKDGKSRIEMAKKELAEAVKKLPKDTYFNMLIFDAKVVSWKSRMLPATEANRKSAVVWAQGLKTGKGTASFDALQRAFAVDSNTEAIFFLSDGQPSKGKVTDTAAIVRIITKENFFRRVAIYTFGFQGVGGEQFMQNLARKNNGKYHAIQ